MENVPFATKLGYYSYNPSGPSKSKRTLLTFHKLQPIFYPLKISLFVAQKETMALNLLVSLFSILISTIFPQPRALQYSQHDRFAFGPNLIHSIITPTSSPTSSTSISPPQPSSLVPALFIIGDSSVDCGTNNFLATLARADHLPYGRDFDTHRPTGRFCNGRIPVDYLGNVGLYFLKTLLFGY